MGATGKREDCLRFYFIISKQDINLSPAELLNLTYLGYYRVLEQQMVLPLDIPCRKILLFSLKTKYFEIIGKSFILRQNFFFSLMQYTVYVARAFSVICRHCCFVLVVIGELVFCCPCIKTVNIQRSQQGIQTNSDSVTDPCLFLPLGVKNCIIKFILDFCLLVQYK